MTTDFFQYSDQIVNCSQSSSEFWKLAAVSNNSDDYRILQELDDHRILMKFSRAFDQNSYVRIQGF